MALNNSLDESRSSEEQYKTNMAAREHQSSRAAKHDGYRKFRQPAHFFSGAVSGRGPVQPGRAEKFSRNRHARNLADYYLYFITAEGLWPNLVLLGFCLWLSAAVTTA